MYDRLNKVVLMDSFVESAISHLSNTTVVWGNEYIRIIGLVWLVESDLQSLFGLHVHSCTHWDIGWDPATPPPPHLGSHTMAQLVSQDRRHLFVTRITDPYSFDTDPDPAFQAEYRSGSGSNPDAGFWWPKIDKKNIQHFKTWNILIFSTFVGHICPPGSRSVFGIRIHWPDWIRIQYGSGSAILVLPPASLELYARGVASYPLRQEWLGKRTHTGVDNHPPIRRGEGKPCERGGGGETGGNLTRRILKKKKPNRKHWLKEIRNQIKCQILPFLSFQSLVRHTLKETLLLPLYCIPTLFRIKFWLA